MSTTRRSLYKMARTLGDVEAAERGPEALVRRRVRRVVYRHTNRLLRSMLRNVGL